MLSIHLVCGIVQFRPIVGVIGMCISVPGGNLFYITTQKTVYIAARLAIHISRKYRRWNVARLHYAGTSLLPRGDLLSTRSFLPAARTSFLRLLCRAAS